MTNQLTTAPVLSTPDTYLFEDPTPTIVTPREKRLNDQELRHVYEVERTAQEIGEGQWSRIALQFPDDMLGDAPRVFEALEIELAKLSETMLTKSAPVDEAANSLQEVDITEHEGTKHPPSRRRLCILADTSYGACCVDEIAAEHVDADVVVHYGRSCLSPTARLPVVYVFTCHPLALDPVVTSFREIYAEKDTKVILMADIIYSFHIPVVLERLQSLGYSNIFAPSIIHDPSSPLPNRTIPPKVVSEEEKLKEYSLFHISDPPRSLLLILSSRLQSMYIYPTTTASAISALQAQTSQLLRRRYALLTSLSTCSVFGILINTLSVKNYLSVISTIQMNIAAAGKKSYTFVVGKVNAAKVANFSEIGGWVVVGCWESSLIESTELYRPIITPFELGLALMSDEDRVWTGEWAGDFSAIIKSNTSAPPNGKRKVVSEEKGKIIDDEDDEDSSPPEFDLRTGKYVSHSRPMKINSAKVSTLVNQSEVTTTTELLKRTHGELAMINGSSSPGAEYLRTQRTWTGLGSDFDTLDGSSAVEQGRNGVARGYTVGDGEAKS